MSPFNTNRRSGFAIRLHVPTDRLCDEFVRIAEPCHREPRIYADVKNGSRRPWAMLFKYFRQAFDACRTRESRHQVVAAITAFLLEGIAHVRTWIVDAPSTRRELFWDAQSSDAEEDVAETIYLMDSTPANAARLIEAGRRERITSELRERHLMLVVSDGAA